MPDARPVIRRRAEGETIEGPVGGPLTFKLRGEESGGRMTAIENVVPPGQGPPLHLHRNEDEAWYVLSGELEFTLGEEVSAAGAGSFVFVPRDTPHCFFNRSAESARILVLFTPAGMERFFDDFASAPPGPQAFAVAAEPVGMDILGPPMGVAKRPPG